MLGLLESGRNEGQQEWRLGVGGAPSHPRRPWPLWTILCPASPGFSIINSPRGQCQVRDARIQGTRGTRQLSGRRYPKNPLRATKGPSSSASAQNPEGGSISSDNIRKRPIKPDRNGGEASKQAEAWLQKTPARRSDVAQGQTHSGTGRGAGRGKKGGHSGLQTRVHTQQHRGVQGGPPHGCR